jgi:cytochrome o ubiquinol oxidase subunit II
MMQPERWLARCCAVWRTCARAGAGGLLLLLSGCSEVALLHPGGPIAASELFVILVAFGLMLIVVIPVVVMALWFPRRYREGNPRGGYDPAWSDSARVDAVIWLIPAAIVAVLATLTWRESHRLDPAVPIRSEVAPLEVDVVSLDWKWLFIYPQQGVAAVNQLVIPARTPISFRLTSGSVMTSFFIPQLGSQIYAMAGRQSRLHLMADAPGVYAGQNQQFSGRGFSGMHFKVLALAPAQFDDWVRNARRARETLDLARFRELSRPGADAPVTVYSGVSPGLFDAVVNRALPQDGAQPQAMGAAEGY